MPAIRKMAENTNHSPLGSGEAPKMLNPAPKNKTPARMLKIAETFRFADDADRAIEILLSRLL